MNKELEALNKIQHDFGQLKGQELVSCYEIIFNALKRLEAIDNANPSEAINFIEALLNAGVSDKHFLNVANHETLLELANIKQALLKAQEQEKENEELKERVQFLEKEYNNLMEDKDNLESELFKSSEPKNYLKWEDLEFNVPTTIKVKMGNTQYLLSLRVSFSDVKSVVLRDNNLKPYLHLFEKEKQFFNDLHLERVLE